jgi:hypothetical protein
MYTEDFVFGPFTLKQSACLFVGFGIAYACISYGGGGKYLYALAGTAIACALVGAYRLKPEYIPLERLPEYLQRKKLTMSRVDFEKFTQAKTADLFSQIEIRKLRGLTPDPALEQALKVFEAAQGVASK